MRKWYRVCAVLIGVVLAMSALAGCGSSGSGGGGGGNANKALEIGTDLPVSGTDAAVGLPTQYGVDLAVDQNKDLGNGYTLTVVHKNDEGASGPDPSIGASNIQQLVSDQQVMAVVGPFNSGVAKQEIPIANRNTLVLISPTNTNPGLTKEQFAAPNGINFALLHPSGKPEAYFRLPGTDDVQGKVDADVAVGLNAKTAYVVDDNTVYGKGLATTFTQEFTGKGGTVAGATSITAQQVSNLTSLATTINGLHPDVVFYGGVTSGGGGALKKDLVAIGYNGPMVGGDGIADDPAWLQTAGNAAANTYGSVAAPDISALTSTAGATFKTDYTSFVAGKPSNDLLPYSASGYDAAMIEITAIKNLIKDGKTVTRTAVRDQVAGISYDGVTGHITFDANGDNSGNKVFSIYWVDPSTGKWAFKQEVNA